MVASSPARRRDSALADDEPMLQVRFYAGLNDFLPSGWRAVALYRRLTRKASVKDLIESFGVPYTEVDLVLVNGEPVDFSHIVSAGERIGVYPLFEQIDLPVEIRLQSPLPVDRRFVVDVNLGRLARYLRLIGFDTLYRNDYEDAEVATISAAENRILLTRDRTLLRRGIIRHGYFVRADKPPEQLREVAMRFDLTDRIRPFSLCIRCNGTLEPVAKEKIIDRLEPKTRRYYSDFLICRDCDQIYWRGSHHRRAMALIETMLGVREER